MKRTVTISLVLATAVGFAGLGYRLGLSRRDAPSPTKAHAKTEPAPSVAVAHHHFDERWLATLSSVMKDYESLQTTLAADQLDPIAGVATQLAATLASADAAALPPGAAETIAALRKAAELMKRAESLDAARVAFAEIGRPLVDLAAMDPRLQEGWALFQCPMVEGFAKWFQRPGPMANPYMGSRMLGCGSKSAWAETPSVAHYTCPMHPSIRSPSPGACPICGMDLVPVTGAQITSGEVRIDESRRQKIGIKLGRVERRVLSRSVAASGRLTYDETKLSEVSLRQRGWVVKLYASATGQTVRRGDVLFTVYSPELLATMKEYQAISARGEETERRASLLQSIEQRLRAWEVGGVEIERLRAGTLSAEAIPVRAKSDGVIVEKNLVEGAAFEAGARLFRIASLDPIWLEAEIYEGDFPLLAVGQEAEVEVTHLPGQILRGRVSYIYPYLDPVSRTARARIELPNAERVLRPEMYASVRLEASLGERLAIPVSAVIYTGPRRLVFVDLGEGRFKPIEVQLGARADQYYEVLGGLAEGDSVVVSGNFLIASESRLRSAVEYWSREGEATRDGHEH